MHIHLCWSWVDILRRKMCLSRRSHIWGMGGMQAGGIQTVVSARNASLPLPVLLKSSLPCFFPALANFLRNCRTLALRCIPTTPNWAPFDF